MMNFLRFDVDYLAKPFVVIAFWASLVGGIVSIALAALWFHGTRWEVAAAAVGVFSLLDACLLRYGYELKRSIVGLYGLYASEDASADLENPKSPL